VLVFVATKRIRKTMYINKQSSFKNKGEERQEKKVEKREEKQREN
jgi:hypothetical protein